MIRVKQTSFFAIEIEDAMAGYLKKRAEGRATSRL